MSSSLFYGIILGRKMPRYDYKCPSCKEVKEKSHSVYENPTYHCAVCKVMGYRSELMRQISAPNGIHFSGSGFYETDYKGK